MTGQYILVKNDLKKKTENKCQSSVSTLLSENRFSTIVVSLVPLFYHGTVCAGYNSSSGKRNQNKSSSSVDGIKYVYMHNVML